MNILFLNSWYPSKKNPNFGVFIKEHAHAIHDAGNNIVVVSLIILKDKQLFKYSKSDFRDEYGVRTIQIEINSSLKDYLYYFIFFQYLIVLRAVNALIKSGFKPDIVHSNVIYSTGIIGYWLAARLHLPHVITEHWSRIENFMSKPVLSKIAVKAYMSSDIIIPVSEFLRNKVRKIIPIIEEKKYKIIGNVVDSTIFNFKEKNNISTEVHFCAIATWNNKKEPDKLPELFIAALSEFQKDTKKKVFLTMVGGGDKIPELKKLCRDKGVHTNFTGYISKTEISSYLQKSDFFIHASTIETFGIVIAEALMCGTPVICSNVGALPELINDSNGVLCNNTIEDWVSGLRALLEKEFHLELISRQIKDKLSLQSIGKQYTGIYENSILKK